MLKSATLPGLDFVRSFSTEVPNPDPKVRFGSLAALQTNISSMSAFGRLPAVQTESQSKVSFERPLSSIAVVQIVENGVI